VALSPKTARTFNQHWVQDAGVSIKMQLTDKLA